MRARLAKKVLKRPWRYSDGSWWAALRRLRAWVIPSASQVRGQYLKEKWADMDMAVLTAARTRLRMHADSWYNMLAGVDRQVLESYPGAK